MKSIKGITLDDVRSVYDGPEGDLWELIMGEQIHIGGFQSSVMLSEKASIMEKMHGVDLCCCSGAGMRFLVLFRRVAAMHGVDATDTVVERGRARCKEEGFDEQITFTLADACDSKLADAGADFVWGEDAWCYVADKPRLISEAARIVKPHGTIAFTDWVEGEAALSDAEAERILRFMKFPNILNLQEYKDLLIRNGCDVFTAEDTNRFAPSMDLYLNMLNQQLTYDALKIIGFDADQMEAMAEEMLFMQEMAHAGKLIQGMYVARKK
ncbi:MAG: methyltransferase domain-containing protein [Planctomycetota bacterium]